MFERAGWVHSLFQECEWLLFLKGLPKGTSSTICQTEWLLPQRKSWLLQGFRCSPQKAMGWHGGCCFQWHGLHTCVFRAEFFSYSFGCVFTLLIALGPWTMPLRYTDNVLGICQNFTDQDTKENWGFWQVITKLLLKQLSWRKKRYFFSLRDIFIQSFKVHLCTVDLLYL